ncbi:MAG: formylglycine-generating enzyme family protein [Methanosarcinaceae archaeon]|nr:formylglycine-generating enzyme family protein [Methanosarcinaceae archaeon]
MGMEFVFIPVGEFKMGAQASESGRDPDEGPVHEVTIGNAFYLGKYEVTQKQWVEVMGSNPSYFKGDDLPVEQVSWNDVQEFIRKLNAMEETDKYRLPSESEWEYACRAGTTTRYSFGDGETELGEYAWYADNADDKTHPVGQKKPNQWGLYDMHGNVWEWVQDEYHSNYEGAPVDGSARDDGSSSNRVLRGGVWNYYAWNCRSANRVSLDANYRDDFTGFRLLREM